MRISKRFNLDVSQFELDFVDIDTSQDLRLFIDPHFLSQRSDIWSFEASTSVQTFFTHFLELLRAGEEKDPRELFSFLGESNDTCLGMSIGTPNGSGVGETLANEMFKNLSESRAVETGVLTDLEDARIFVHGVDKDRVSDMTTALIRKHLLQYTIDQCNLWGIQLIPNLASGDVWDANSRNWTTYSTERLIIGNKPILLVPKGIVSYSKQYTASKYHRHFVLNYLKHEHLRLDTVLVQRRRRRDGSVRKWVTKKSVIEHESPGDKEYLTEFTEKHVEVFANFKNSAAKEERSLSNEQFTDVKIEEVIAHLVELLSSMLPGIEEAGRYHRLVAGILELCFYPSLIAPRLENQLHSGRKRIDITFVNAATEGFFHRQHEIHKIPSGYIMTECKNYSKDVNNPELDQLAGRFGVNRGQVGLMIFRTVEDMDTLIQPCADAFKDGRGLLIPLSDGDLKVMLWRRSEGTRKVFEDLLTERMQRIAMM